MDESTLAIINYANTNGYAIPSNLTAFDNLIKGMKSCGIWALLDRFWLFSGDGSSDFKRINLINPNKPLADFYGGLTISNSGIKGNGVNARILTAYNPANDAEKFLTADASLFGVCSQAATTPTAAFVATLNTNRNQLGTANSSGFRLNTGTITTNLNSSVSMGGNGFKSMSRTSSSDVELVSKGDLFNRRQGDNSLTVGEIILFQNATGYSQHELQCFGMGKSITYEKSQDFRTIFNQYLTAIGESPVA